MQSIGQKCAGDSRCPEQVIGLCCAGLSLLAGGRCSSLHCVEVNPAGKAAFEAALQRLQQQLSQQAALRGLPEPHLPPTDYAVGPAAVHAPGLLGRADVIVVDPPRRGLDGELLQVLCQASPVGAAELSGGAARRRRLSATVTGPVQGGSGSESALRSRSKPARRGNASIQQQRPHCLIYLSCGLDALMRDVDVLMQQGRWALVHAEVFGFFPGTDSVETLVIFRRA